MPPIQFPDLNPFNNDESNKAPVKGRIWTVLVGGETKTIWAPIDQKNIKDYMSGWFQVLPSEIDIVGWEPGTSTYKETMKMADDGKFLKSKGGDTKHKFVPGGADGKCKKPGCDDKKEATSHFSASDSGSDAQIPAQISQALGFRADEKATVDQVLAVISGIKAENVTNFGEGNAALRREVASLRHEQLTAKYAKVADSLTLVEGTPAELTTKFVEFHEKFGEGEATTLVSSYKAVQVAAEGVGTGRAHLMDRAPASSSFMEAVDKYASDNPKSTRSDAMDHVQKSEPVLYREYQDERVERNGFGKVIQGSALPRQF